MGPGTGQHLLHGGARGVGERSQTLRLPLTGELLGNGVASSTLQGSQKGCVFTGRGRPGDFSAGPSCLSFSPG